MKSIFIEVKTNENYKIDLSKIINKLPKNICLAMTVQFTDQIKEVKEQLEKANKNVILFQGRHTQYPGQILGCDLKADQECDAFLYVGDGLFHPKAIMMNTKKDVYAYSPFSKTLQLLDKSESEKMQKKMEAGYKKFLLADNIGIIVTTKIGQHNSKHADKIIEKYKDKHFYKFICDTLDFTQLENFPFIDCWINTMCPRAAIDDYDKYNKPVINMEQLGFEF